MVCEHLRNNSCHGQKVWCWKIFMLLKISYSIKLKTPLIVRCIMWFSRTLKKNIDIYCKIHANFEYVSMWNKCASQSGRNLMLLFLLHMTPWRRNNGRLQEGDKEISPSCFASYFLFCFLFVLSSLQQYYILILIYHFRSHNSNGLACAGWQHHYPQWVAVSGSHLSEVLPSASWGPTSKIPVYSNSNLLSFFLLSLGVVADPKAITWSYLHGQYLFYQFCITITTTYIKLC